MLLDLLQIGFSTFLVRSSFTAAPKNISCTPTSITLKFPPSEPVADEYRLEYTGSESIDYYLGRTVQHREQQSRYTVTQDGLQPGTSYRFRIVPYVGSVHGIESPALVASTCKYLFEIVPRCRCISSTS